MLYLACSAQYHLYADYWTACPYPHTLSGEQGTENLMMPLRQGRSLQQQLSQR